MLTTTVPEKQGARLQRREPTRAVETPNGPTFRSRIVREDEQQLVSSAQAGDVAAFEELVNRYEDRIFRLTKSITRNHEDAEDAMQEAFLNAYAHLRDFRGGSRFYTWLVRIAVNGALMRLRRRRPNQVPLEEAVRGDIDLMPLEVEDWGPNPEQKYATAEMSRILNDLIDGMSPVYRIVLVLRDIEELSVQETSDALGISVPAVKTRLLRARLMLRERLDTYFHKRGA